MIHVLLALGRADLRDWLVASANAKEQTCDFCPFAYNRGEVVNLVRHYKPDVIILDEDLPKTAQCDISIDELTSMIQRTSSECRICVSCTETHEEGDAFLKSLISKGIYDIAVGERIKAVDILNMIYTRKTYEQVRHLQGKIDYVPDVNSGSSVRFVESVPLNQKAAEIKTSQPYSSAYSNDTTILSNENNPLFPQGTIIFYPYQDVDSTSLLSAAPTSSKGYYEKKTLTVNSNDKPMYPAVYKNQLGKVITVTAARQGVGCTAVAVNTAFALASMDKTVLLIDLNFGGSCVFEKLNIPTEFGYTLDQVIDEYNKGNNISSLCLNKSKLNNNSEQIQALPEKLSFLRLSDDISKTSTLNGLEKVLDFYKMGFNYIIIDAFLGDYESSAVSQALNISSKVILATIQDVYEVNAAYSMVKKVDSVIPITGKLVPFVNRYVKNGMPDMNVIAGVLGTQNCFVAKTDTDGFMRSSASGLAYYLYASKKNKAPFEQLGILL